MPQLHAPAICFSGGSKLSLVASKGTRLSKATTLSATCPSHLHAPAICFHGVQDCRLPGFKPSKRFRRPFQGKTAVCPASTPQQASKATTLTATCPCHLFFTGFKTAVLQTPQQASKATTLTATCPCHLFFKGFKTAVCPASNSPNSSAGLSKATTLTATCPCQLHCPQLEAILL